MNILYAFIPSTDILWTIGLGIISFGIGWFIATWFVKTWQMTNDVREIKNLLKERKEL